MGGGRRLGGPRHARGTLASGVRQRVGGAMERPAAGRPVGNRPNHGGEFSSGGPLHEAAIRSGCHLQTCSLKLEAPGKVLNIRFTHGPARKNYHGGLHLVEL